jgi:pyridoxal phosphate enzyme (YggS family)
MIKENIQAILRKLPPGVELVAATKDRTTLEIEEAISAGIKIIGENYLKEAQAKFEALKIKVKWHFIGHLQRNKARLAVKIFDMIETLDSLKLAEVLNQEAKRIDRIMPVLIEINSSAEPQKSGLRLEEAEGFLKSILHFDNLRPMGLMTMGPWLDDPQKLRPYFRKTKDLFDKIKFEYSGKLEWRYLSMGMSQSYEVAIEEKANIVRVGTAIFGKRSR